MELQEFLNFLNKEIEKTIEEKDKEKLKKIRITLDIVGEFIELQNK